MDLRIVRQHPPSVFEDQLREISLIDGAQVEQSVDLAEAARGLAAARPSFCIEDCVAPIPFDAARIQIDSLAFLSDDRLDRIAPEAGDRSDSMRHGSMRARLLK